MKLTLNSKKFCFHFSLVSCCPSVSNIWYLYTHLYVHITNNLIHGWIVCTIFIIHSLWRIVKLTRFVALTRSSNDRSQIVAIKVNNRLDVLNHFHPCQICQKVPPHLTSPTLAHVTQNWTDLKIGKFLSNQLVNTSCEAKLYACLRPRVVIVRAISTYRDISA